MKLIASIMRSWKSSKSLSSVMFSRKDEKRNQCFDPWVWFISLGDANSTVSRLKWSTAIIFNYPWTFAGRDTHRIKHTVHTSFSCFAKCNKMYLNRWLNADSFTTILINKNEIAFSVLWLLLSCSFKLSTIDETEELCAQSEVWITSEIYIKVLHLLQKSNLN